MAGKKITRREVIKKAVYVTPVILTLAAKPSFARSGSGIPSQKSGKSSKGKYSSGKSSKGKYPSGKSSKGKYSSGKSRKGKYSRGKRG